MKTQADKEVDAYNDSMAKIGVDFKGNWNDIINWVKTSATPAMVAAFKDMSTQASAETAKLGLGGNISVPSTSSVAKNKLSGGTSTHNISINLNGAMTFNKEADIANFSKKVADATMNAMQMAQKGMY